MKILKGVLLSLFGFLLFLSLSIFSLAFTLNSTILDPEFITSELDKLDISATVAELFSEPTPGEEFPEEFRTALLNTITSLEPSVKAQISATIESVYDYLLGKKEEPELALTLRSTILTADFLASVIDAADVSSLAAGFLSKQLTEQIPEGMASIVEGLLDDVITELEPTVKAELTAAADPILDYILGQSPSLRVVIPLEPIKEKLKDALSENLAELSPQAVEPFFKEFVIAQVSQVIPPEMAHLAEAAVTDQWVKEQTNTAIIPILNYIGGKSQSLDVVISLEPIVNELKAQGLVTEIPSTLAINESLLGANLPAQIDELSQGLTAAIPETFVIDESMIGTDLPAQIAEALAQAEEALVTAKQYIGYFQRGYQFLIGLMLLLTLGIILISRQVRDISRRLGIPCLTYGALWYAGILVGKYIAQPAIQQLELSPSLQAWLSGLLDSSTRPLEMLSLGLLVVGVILVIISFIYKPRQS